ncbi:hypothetical protein KIN20_005871 [Parelaphostrongylus tenuis]|uniref:Secreted protein n=1 Tax=Parelaphostrongylus tenuis TaxID=148309 RepID=A0AAD5M567_PARTN|nr:hypothetical protein KIN20_005871 [Parelaphostrongylus tenuis]
MAKLPTAGSLIITVQIITTVLGCGVMPPGKVMNDICNDTTNSRNFKDRLSILITRALEALPLEASVYLFPWYISEVATVRTEVLNIAISKTQLRQS